MLQASYLSSYVGMNFNIGAFLSKLFKNLKPENINKIKEDILRAEALARMKESVQR